MTDPRTTSTTPRTPWVIGNWKQNLLRDEASALATRLLARVPEVRGDVRVGIAPTALCLPEVSALCAQGAIATLAQRCGRRDAGAHTGEIGPRMLLDAGAAGALIGHSERRGDQGESSDDVAACAAAALAAGMTTVVCVGEPLSVRDAGDHETFVISMMLESLQEIELEQLPGSLVMAYEPVWAIGTGKTASAAQAGEMHLALRRALDARFGEAGRRVPLLYGGSVKPANAAGLLAPAAIDGFLVGGASLDADAFVDIVALTAKARRT